MVSTGIIASVMNEDLVRLELQAKDGKAAVEELAGLLEKAGKIRSKVEFIQDVTAREQLTSTSMGFGIAIPHARSSAVLEAALAFGRSEGFRWSESDEDLVYLVFLLAVPDSNAKVQHLQILSSLARMLLDESFRESLRGAQSPRDVLAVIEEVIKGRND
jgi:fructose-specific phosphotransferase system IIA component